MLDITADVHERWVTWTKCYGFKGDGVYFILPSSADLTCIFVITKTKEKKKLRGLWKQNKFVLARVWNISKTIHVFLHNRKHFQSLKDVKAKTVYTINRRLQNLQNSAFECLPAYCSGLYKVRHQCEFEIKDKTGSNTDSKLPLQPHSYLNLSNFT